jgi:DNA-binding HxlR family transcriptional regulator
MGWYGEWVRTAIHTVKPNDIATFLGKRLSGSYQGNYRGRNFFDRQDREVLEAIGQGEFCIRGMQNKTLRKLLPGRSTQQVSRTIKRLRTHGLVKKTARSYKYYLTPLGREVVAAGLRLKQFVILEELRDRAA